VTNGYLQKCVEAVNEWISLYRSVSIAGLPATERRAQLEKIMWQALQQVVEYSKSEEAAKNAEERIEVLELLNRAVKAELAVLHEQDAFYVQDLVEQIQARMRKIEEENEEHAET
jgi:hypothetical protein